jgi:hypothetical protein
VRLANHGRLVYRDWQILARWVQVAHVKTSVTFSVKSPNLKCLLSRLLES